MADFPGWTLELPAGVYYVSNTILVRTSGITIRTANTKNQPWNCAENQGGCAWIVAARNTPQAQFQGYIFAVWWPTSPTTDVPLSNVTIDHLGFNGDWQHSLGSYADGLVRSGYATAGMNAAFWDCTSCALTNSASIGALAGTSMGWLGDYANIGHNYFGNNGQVEPNGLNVAAYYQSDGLTVHRSNYANIHDNLFSDNADCALILGSGRFAAVSNNTIRQVTQRAFAAIMLDNFNDEDPGDFAGANIWNNTIDGGSNFAFDFGFNVGPHAWYPSNKISVWASAIHDNTIANTLQSINVSGAEDYGSPMYIYNNDIQRPSVPASAMAGRNFACGGEFCYPGFAVSLVNIAPDSASSVITLNLPSWAVSEVPWPAQVAGPNCSSLANETGCNGVCGCSWNSTTSTCTFAPVCY
jgi:hypothetical protein